MIRPVLRASSAALILCLSAPALPQSLPPLTPSQRQEILMDVSRPIHDNMGLGGVINYQPTGGGFWGPFLEWRIIWQRAREYDEAESFDDRPRRRRTPDPNVRNLVEQGGGGGAGGAGGGGGSGGAFPGDGIEVALDEYVTSDEYARQASEAREREQTRQEWEAQAREWQRAREQGLPSMSDEEFLEYVRGWQEFDWPLTEAEQNRLNQIEEWADEFARQQREEFATWGASSPSLYANLQTFLDSGGSLAVAELLAIYADFDYANPASRSGMSLSAAGNSPSAAGMSFSSAGISFSSAGTSFSSAGMSFSLAGGPFALPGSLDAALALARPQQASARSRSGYGLIADASRRLSRFSAEGRLVGFIDGLTHDELVRALRIGGLTGLDRLLAQPFNVVLTWGAGAFDVDLHMTGPTGTAGGSRFWIYYAQTGSLEAFPFAQLIRDCICASGSEVILTTRLNQGGVYRISAFNYGNQSTSSTQLSTNADLQLLIVRGGVAVPAGNGTTIEGGRVIFRGRPAPNRPGNTWVGVEIDPRTGQIRFVDRIDNSVNGDGTAATRAARSVPAIAAAAAIERAAARRALRRAEPSRRFERPRHAQ